MSSDSSNRISQLSQTSMPRGPGRGPWPALSERPLLTGLVLVLVAGCSVAASPSPAAEVEASPSRQIVASPALHQAESGSIADVVESVVPCVVSVMSTKKPKARHRHPFFFGQPGGGRPQSGLGSGVILSRDGIIVTNNHVIEGADSVKVQIHDEREFDAVVVGADPKSDVAVLRLKGEVKDLTPIRVGNSGDLRLGDVVLAVGNPFGVGQTVTMGIVSATGRSDMGIVDYENFIQTDAAINPGNSGGALINMRGELVGINTAILSRSGGSQGIGFAIPTNMAQPIIDALQADGKVTRGYLGVRIQDLDADLKKALSLGAKDGVLIADVQDDGPAREAGLKSGDVVTHVGGTSVTSTGQFRNLIASSQANRKVVLKVIRGKKSLTLKVKLGVLPRDERDGGGEKESKKNGIELDGLSLKTLDRDLRERLDVPQGVTGAVIVRVKPGSKASAARLARGDILLQINRKPVATAAEAKTVYSSIKGPKLLQILRSGSRRYAVIK